MAQTLVHEFVWSDGEHIEEIDGIPQLVAGEKKSEKAYFILSLSAQRLFKNATGKTAFQAIVPYIDLEEMMKGDSANEVYLAKYLLTNLDTEVIGELAASCYVTKTGNSWVPNIASYAEFKEKPYFDLICEDVAFVVGIVLLALESLTEDEETAKKVDAGQAETQSEVSKSS